jgi:transcriptional regulator with XRE-family HTH domain
MRGVELKEWRLTKGWRQSELMDELGVSSRQTIATWESSETVPRLVELAVIALDQVEACRHRAGYEKTFTREQVANQWVVNGQKHFEQTK